MNATGRVRALRRCVLSAQGLSVLALAGCGSGDAEPAPLTSTLQPRPEEQSATQPFETEVFARLRRVGPSTGLYTTLTLKRSSAMTACAWTSIPRGSRRSVACYELNASPTFAHPYDPATVAGSTGSVATSKASAARQSCCRPWPRPPKRSPLRTGLWGAALYGVEASRSSRAPADRQRLPTRISPDHGSSGGR
jgi:hypothetical protein